MTKKKTSGGKGSARKLTIKKPTNNFCPPVTDGCQTLVNCLPTFYGCAIRRG